MAFGTCVWLLGAHSFIALATASIAWVAVSVGLWVCRKHIRNTHKLVAQMEPIREYARALQPSCHNSLISMDLIRYVARSSCGVRSFILSAPIVDRLSAVSMRAALSVGLAVCLIPMGAAQAELFWPQYRSWEGYDNAPFSQPDRSLGNGDYEPFRQRPPRAHIKHESRPKADRQRTLHREESKPKAKTHEVAKPEPKTKSGEVAKGEPKTKTQEVAKGPLQIIISIADQRISVYDDGTLIARSSVSTGVPGHPTPLGVFSVIGKELWHRSNIYSAAPMPYMQRITWSGIALHAGVLPGHPASHGCIRLANDFAIRLWHLTKRGTRVIIARNDVHPVQIASPHLFSKPKTASSSQGHSVDAVAGKDILTLATSPAPLAQSAQSQGDQNLLPATGFGPRKKAVPITAFVSRKLSKIFVRQGFTPLFDVPIKIENPDEPLGTHVFTVLGLQNGGGSFRWNVVSMPDRFSSTSGSLNKQPKTRVQATGVRSDSSSGGATVALDRVEIPQDQVDQLSQLLTPGSSLILSDYELSTETGDDTDFIVVIP
jgi:lipoprotein-anchoring transpeptidase ErfK/SrfK